MTPLPNVLPTICAFGLFGKWRLDTAVAFRPPENGWNVHVGTLGGVLPEYFNRTMGDSRTSDVGAATTNYATIDIVTNASL